MFQSTRPVRGATLTAIQRRAMNFVSIHAPRAGRDFALFASSAVWSFQSTRPVRGATTSSADAFGCSMFQSTRPVRGATHELEGLLLDVVVSIHAPRAGRDCSPCFLMSMRTSFNPRAPCGARQQKRSRLPSFATYSWVLLAMNTVCLAHTSHTPPLMWFTHLYFFTSFSVYFTFALLKVLRKALINSAPPS